MEVRGSFPCTYRMNKNKWYKHFILKMKSSGSFSRKDLTDNEIKTIEQMVSDGMVIYDSKTDGYYLSDEGMSFCLEKFGKP